MSFFSQSHPAASHTLCGHGRASLLGRDGRGKEAAALGLQHDPVLPKDDSSKLKQGMASSGRAERESYALSQLVSYKSSSKLTLHGDKWAWASVELRHKSESKHKWRHLIEGTVTSAPSCQLPDPSRCPSSMSAQNSGCWQFTLLPASLFVLGWVYSLATISLTLHSSSLCWLENHLSVTTALLITRC